MARRLEKNAAPVKFTGDTPEKRVRSAFHNLEKKILLEIEAEISNHIDQGRILPYNLRSLNSTISTTQE